jgi:TolA-binding protein
MKPKPSQSGADKVGDGRDQVSMLKKQLRDQVMLSTALKKQLEDLNWKIEQQRELKQRRRNGLSDGD